MILYLPEPFEFPVEEKNETAMFVLKLPSGGELEVKSCGQNQVQVLNIRSTDPMDYLHPKYQPGSVIILEANLE